MCGRFALAVPGKNLATHFQMDSIPDLAPRYNIAPTQTVPAVIRAGSGERALGMYRWGLIPFWADDMSIGPRLINARAETAAEKPAFRAAFRRQRCLIPVTGFYEWTREKTGKQPYYFHRQDGGLFAFAGLWELWEKDAEPVLSCTILTTGPNEVMRPVHDRMPVIVSPENYEAWLDPGTLPDAAQAILVPAAEDALTVYSVGTEVNSPRTDHPGLIEPLESP